MQAEKQAFEKDSFTTTLSHSSKVKNYDEKIEVAK